MKYFLILSILLISILANAGSAESKITTKNRVTRNTNTNTNTERRFLNEKLSSTRLVEYLQMYAKMILQVVTTKQSSYNYRTVLKSAIKNKSNKSNKSLRQLSSEATATNQADQANQANQATRNLRSKTEEQQTYRIDMRMNNIFDTARDVYFDKFKEFPHPIKYCFMLFEKEDKNAKHHEVCSEQDFKTCPFDYLFKKTFILFNRGASFAYSVTGEMGSYSIVNYPNMFNLNNFSIVLTYTHVVDLQLYPEPKEGELKEGETLTTIPVFPEEDFVNDGNHVLTDIPTPEEKAHQDKVMLKCMPDDFKTLNDKIVTIAENANKILEKAEKSFSAVKDELAGKINKICNAIGDSLSLFEAKISKRRMRRLNFLETNSKSNIRKLFGFKLPPMPKIPNPIKGVKNVADKAIDVTKAIGGEIGDVATEAGSTLAGAVGTAGDAIGDASSATVATISDAGGMVVNGVTYIGGGVADAPFKAAKFVGKASTIAGGVKKIMDFIFNKSKGLVNTAWKDGVKNPAGAVAGTVAGGLASGARKVGDVVYRQADRSQEAIGTIITKTVNLGKQGFLNVKNTGESAIGAIKYVNGLIWDGTVHGLRYAGGKVVGGVSATASGVKWIGGKFLTVLGKAAEETKNAAGFVAGKLVDGAMYLGNKIVDETKNTIDESMEGVSSVFKLAHQMCTKDPMKCVNTIQNLWQNKDEAVDKVKHEIDYVMNGSKKEYCTGERVNLATYEHVQGCIASSTKINGKKVDNDFLCDWAITTDIFADTPRTMWHSSHETRIDPAWMQIFFKDLKKVDRFTYVAPKAEDMKNYSKSKKPKQIKLLFSNDSEQLISPEEKAGNNIFIFDLEPVETMWVKVIITETYSGRKDLRTGGIFQFSGYTCDVPPTAYKCESGFNQISKYTNEALYECFASSNSTTLNPYGEVQSCENGLRDRWGEDSMQWVAKTWDKQPWMKVIFKHEYSITHFSYNIRYHIQDRNNGFTLFFSDGTTLYHDVQEKYDNKFTEHEKEIQSRLQRQNWELPVGIKASWVIIRLDSSYQRWGDGSNGFKQDELAMGGEFGFKGARCHEIVSESAGKLGRLTDKLQEHGVVDIATDQVKDILNEVADHLKEKSLEIFEDVLVKSIDIFNFYKKWFESEIWQKTKSMLDCIKKEYGSIEVDNRITKFEEVQSSMKDFNGFIKNFLGTACQWGSFQEAVKSITKGVNAKAEDANEKYGDYGRFVGNIVKSFADEKRKREEKQREIAFKEEQARERKEFEELKKIKDEKDRVAAWQAAVDIAYEQKGIKIVSTPGTRIYSDLTYIKLTNYQTNRTLMSKVFSIPEDNMTYNGGRTVSEGHFVGAQTRRDDNDWWKLQYIANTNPNPKKYDLSTDKFTLNHTTTKGRIGITHVAWDQPRINSYADNDQESHLSIKKIWDYTADVDPHHLVVGDMIEISNGGLKLYNDALDEVNDKTMWHSMVYSKTVSTNESYWVITEAKN